MGIESLILNELREVNKNLAKILKCLVVITENQKNHNMQVTFLRNEMYSYFRKLHPEDAETKEDENND